jgi:lipoate---protein ligase
MQIISSCSNHPGFNLAAEEYLFSQRQDEILFLYTNVPCVVIGCNQAILNEAETGYCTEKGIVLHRRLSGGGAVYHDSGNLNFCFIKNREEGKFPLGAAFLQPIVQALNALDVPVEIGNRKDLWLPDGFKVSGTASHVGKTRELHHGTLLYDTNLIDLHGSLKEASQPTATQKPGAVASVSSPVKNIRNYLLEKRGSALPASDFFQLLTQKLLDFYRQQAVQSFTELECRSIRVFQAARYDSADWTSKK